MWLLKYSRIYIFSLLIASVGYAQINTNEVKAEKASDFTKHTMSPGLIMAGYQGWFNTPEDGAKRGWYHLAKKKENLNQDSAL